MADEAGDVDWYRPHMRAIVPIDERLHVSRSLQRTIRRGRFVVSTDLCFEHVIRECAAVSRSGEGGAWLSQDIIQLFGLFHAAGFAHSVEVWAADEHGSERVPVGGIYGVSVGRVFCAESMYCRPELGGTDASKVALIRLASLVKSLGYEALDAQILNPHTAQFGTYEIPDETYCGLLKQWASVPALPWPEPGPLDMRSILPWRGE